MNVSVRPSPEGEPTGPDNIVGMHDHHSDHELPVRGEHPDETRYSASV